MAQELIYTSAERGLRPGTRGFCTVAYTRGMMPQTVQLLEAMSAYKSMYSAQEAALKDEPVSWAHVKGGLLGHTASVLSRVSPTAVDHTNRSNKLAHHLLIQPRERPLGGPLWLTSQPDVFLEHWDDVPHLIEQQRVLPEGDETEYQARYWQELTGDAGHAGILASWFHENSERIVYLAYEPGMDMHLLLREAMALLMPEERWNVTYNTYFNSLPAGVTCVWRCCVVDSDALREGRRNPRAQVLDLTRPLPEPKAENCYVRRAREGGAPLPQVEPENQKAKPGFTLLHSREINQLSMKPRKL